MTIEKKTFNLTNHYHEGDTEQYFQQYRTHIIGQQQLFQTAYGTKKMLYADWTASGRLYRPIETKLTNILGSFVGNTHTESTITGKTTTSLYQHARQLIKAHANASESDVLISTGSGMTSAINKLQRLLGLRAANPKQQEVDRPIIFVSHMEHHSNYLSWHETIGDVITLSPTCDGSINAVELEQLLIKYADRKRKIGAFTACSNVTGLETNYYQLSRIMHQHDGICFIDFAASAPYVDMNMHPDETIEKLDGIFFSPHKFLGGPGSSGILIVDQALLANAIPDNPGGGTVLWTDYWGKYSYLKDIESREDGGTPPFIQTIKAALAMQLKDAMQTDLIRQREEEMLAFFLPRLAYIDRIKILGYPANCSRLGIISFCAIGIHHHLFVQLLNDRFGIQARGGCSCAGPYGHYLLNISPAYSKKMIEQVETGDMSLKPGWIRLSLHPVMTDNELRMILFAIQSIVAHIDQWQADYYYHPDRDTYIHKYAPDMIGIVPEQFFSI